MTIYTQDPTRRKTRIYILSLSIFNIYPEQIFKEALEDVDVGMLLNGERLNNIRYPDDAVIFGDTLVTLQLLVTINSQKYGLDINTNKTKFMVISKSNVLKCNIESNQMLVVRELIIFMDIINETE